MVSWGQVRHWRVGRQFLRELDGGSAAEVARRLNGVQAQVPSAAALAVAARQRTPDPNAVATALKKNELIRTWGVRGTLHLLTPDYAPKLLSLVAASRTWEKAVWQKNFITTAQLARLVDGVTTALQDGKPKTRPELLDYLDDDLREHAGSGWSAVLKPLAWQGLLMQGPAVGNRVTFVRPPWQQIDNPDEVAPEVILDYLGTYGPSTPAAFDQWLVRGVTSKPRLRRWFAALDDRVSTVDVDGQVLVVRNQDLEEIRETEPRPIVRLLPGFDQFVLGPGTGDEQTLPREHRTEVSRPGGWISPVIMIDGRVAGTWQNAGEQITTSLFEPVKPRVSTLLKKEIERMAGLLGRGLSPNGSAEAEA